MTCTRRSCVLARYHGKRMGVKAEKGDPGADQSTCHVREEIPRSFSFPQCAWQHREVDSIGVGFVRSIYSKGVRDLTEVFVAQNRPVGLLAPRLPIGDGTPHRHVTAPRSFSEEGGYMNISRRDFLRLCTASSAALALSPLDIFRLEQALANPAGPSVLWLQGAGCTGCSVSFLNRIAPTAPTTAADVLINTINLAYHPNLMAAAGETAVAVARRGLQRGRLCPGRRGRHPDRVRRRTRAGRGAEQRTRRDLRRRGDQPGFAARRPILCVGTCAAWGGISAACRTRPACRASTAVTGKTTINIAGCPPHPDWMVWAIVQSS